MKTNVKNRMSRPFGLRIGGKREVIQPGLSISVDKDLWTETLKTNHALNAYLSQGRLVTSESSEAPVEVVTDKSGDAKKPENLEETKQVTEGKVTHTARTEKVEVSTAPKGGKKVS